MAEIEQIAEPAVDTMFKVHRAWGGPAGIDVSGMPGP